MQTRFTRSQLDTALLVCTAVAPDAVQAILQAKPRATLREEARLKREARSAAWLPVGKANAEVTRTRLAFEAIDALGWRARVDYPEVMAQFNAAALAHENARKTAQLAL